MTLAPPTWTVYPEDVARLQGTVYNNSNVNAFFEVDFYFDLGQLGRVGGWRRQCQ